MQSHANKQRLRLDGIDRAPSASVVAKSTCSPYSGLSNQRRTFHRDKSASNLSDQRALCPHIIPENQRQLFRNRNSALDRNRLQQSHVGTSDYSDRAPRSQR